MNRYSTPRNSLLATALVAALASLVSTALAADQKIVFQRDLPEAAALVVLPEIVVTASRLAP